MSEKPGFVLPTLPTNLYDWVASTIPAIREEPKRLNLHVWKLVQENCDKDTIWYPPNEYHGIPINFPSCGYVGCIIGWMGHRINYVGFPDVWAIRDIVMRTQPSFAGSREGVEFLELSLGRGDYLFPSWRIQGTKEYADQAIANIEKYLSRHARALKTIPLKFNNRDIKP